MEQELADLLRRMILEPKELNVRQLDSGVRVAYSEALSNRDYQIVCALNVTWKYHHFVDTAIQKEIGEWVTVLLRQSTRQGLGVLVSGPERQTSIVSRETMLTIRWTKMKVAHALRISSAERNVMNHWLNQVDNYDVEDGKHFWGNGELFQQKTLL